MLKLKGWGSKKKSLCCCWGPWGSWEGSQRGPLTHYVRPSSSVTVYQHTPGEVGGEVAGGQESKSTSDTPRCRGGNHAWWCFNQPGVRNTGHMTHSTSQTSTLQEDVNQNETWNIRIFFHAVFFFCNLDWLLVHFNSFFVVVVCFFLKLAEQLRFRFFCRQI